MQVPPLRFWISSSPSCATPRLVRHSRPTPAACHGVSRDFPRKRPRRWSCLLVLQNPIGKTGQPGLSATGSHRSRRRSLAFERHRLCQSPRSDPPASTGRPPPIWRSTLSERFSRKCPHRHDWRSDPSRRRRTGPS